MLDKEDFLLDIVTLQAFVAKHFSLAELQQLCFELEVRYDNLPGEQTIDSKSRHLLELLKRHGRLPELVKLLEAKRQNFDVKLFYKQRSPLSKKFDGGTWRKLLTKKNIVLGVFVLATGIILSFFVPQKRVLIPNEAQLMINELQGCDPQIREQIIKQTIEEIEHVILVDYSDEDDNFLQAGLINIVGECHNDEVSLTINSNQLSPVFVSLFDVPTLTLSPDTSLFDKTKIIRGVIHYVQGNYDSAVTIFKELDNSNEVITLYFANSLLLSRAYDSAEDAYGLLLEQSGDPIFVAGVFNNKGVSLFNQAIELDLEDIEAVDTLKEEAIKSFDEGLKVLGQHPVLLPMLYANKGILYGRFGNYDEGKLNCQMALETNRLNVWSNICLVANNLPQIILSESCNETEVRETVQFYLTLIAETNNLPVEYYFWQRTLISVENKCRFSTQSSPIDSLSCENINLAISELERRGFAPLDIHEDMQESIPSC